MSKQFWLAVLAYVLPTFPLGYVWHLILFEDYYAALQIYRGDVIVPLGLASMLIQALLFAWIYDKAFAEQPGRWLARGLRYALTGGLLSWSYTTLAVGAKNLMASVPDYILIETAFTIVQWIIVGPLTALAFSARRGIGREAAA